MSMKIQVVVFCVVTCKDVIGYKRFEGLCCLHLHPEVEAAKPFTSVHGDTVQRTTT